MEPPSFSINSPPTVTAVPGSDASIVLPLPSGSPPFQYEWSRAGAKLDDRFKPSDDAGGVRLTISTASSGDSGVYTLQASNAAGKDTTRVRLEITPDEKPTGDDPPTFLRRLQDLTVKVGTRTRFLVEIVSSTECRVTWYRNERRLLEAERIALVRDGNFWCADISAVSVDDSGRWTCTAENVGGRASCSAHLNVLVPKAYKRPEFVEELRALLTEQGTVSLECKVVGVPTPVLRWFKDSREIKAGDVFALTANAEDPTSLGTYTCEAVNCMGRAYSSSKVHVIGRASREGSARPASGGVALEPPPIFTKELEDQFVRICEPLTLSCHIVVPPWPRSIVWYNKEGKIESSDKYRVLEDGVGGYLLEIPSAEWQDEGEWKCVATSSGGRIGISTCYVSMDVPKNYRKPRFMENLQAVLTEEGLVSFECKVVGFPTPVLSWFKDGQELKPGDVYQLTGTNSLGSYCCIARNCMGHASSSAELTVEDIQNQLNEEEKLQLFSKNQAPKFLQGLKSVEAKIDEPFRFTIKVAIPPEPTVLWYRDDQPVDETSRCHHGKEERGVFFIDIQSLEFMDQAEWKCVAMNDFGHSITSCFLKLIIPRHYKKPRFLENLQAILSDEGAVNLECKVIGVPQPVLKWYKDGEELKPGDIHRIISGQDGTCCLGTYTCEAQNCMGIAASSASLLGFEDSIKAKSKKNADEQTLQRNLSLSTIHEERTSQMYDTPVGDITLDDKGEITYSFDGKEVSVSLYETPDLTEEEALQIVEMYADQLSENVTEHNVVELPPLRFVKETSTSGNLLMEAIIIDVSPEYFTSPEEDLRTEADIEDISIADENCPPQLSQDQEMDGAEDYLEKTMALLSDEKAIFPKKTDRKKSDSQKSVDDYFSLSRDQSLSEEKKDDDTQGLSESDLQSFASARSSGKPKSKSSKPSIDDGQESSDLTKTVLLKEDLQILNKQNELDSIMKNKRERRSRSSRRSSSGSEKSLSKMKEEALVTNLENNLVLTNLDQQSTEENINNICLSLAKLINDVQVIERDIILKSELMSTAATASRSLEIINSIIVPLSEIHSIAEAMKETVSDSLEVTTSLFNKLPQSLSNLYQSLTIVEKCIDVESENKTLVKKTCTSIIEKCGDDLNNLVGEINSLVNKGFQFLGDICVASIQRTTNDLNKTVTCSLAEIRESKKLSDRIDANLDITTPELKHLQKTQKAVYELRNSLKSLLHIAKEVNISSFVTADHITNSQIILNDMSTPIQDLQSALEQIEALSVTETQFDIQKYNTEIIETVMEPVIKLRTSFEQLSVEAGTMEKVDVLNEVLYDIKHNINEISAHLDIFETKIGSFNILQSENKLEALQKMAQILINLENNLAILEIIPCLKIHMADFHKNLTKVLEHVIESNDAQKYFAFLEICDSVNRINVLIKNVDSKDSLALAGIINNLKTVQANIEQNEFTPELNLSILSNVTDLLINIQETINQADISTYSMNSENVEDLSIRGFEEEKLNIVLEQIEKAITTISNVISLETTNNLVIKKTLNQIVPTLGELKCCVASLNVNVNEKEDNISDMSSFAFTQAAANPLCELNLSISVLTQIICEKASDDCEHSLLKAELATPLVELRNALEILQHDVISQNEENVNDPKISSSVANAVQSIQSCIVVIQEQNLLENADEVSTLDDISAIKTTADMLFTDYLISPEIHEITAEINAENTLYASTECLKVLNDHIIMLQNDESMAVLHALSKREESACIKTIVARLETLHCAIEGILHPITYEESQKRSSIPNATQLLTIIQPIRELLQSLSVIDISNMSSESTSSIDQIKLLTQNVSKLEIYLRDSLDFINVSVETSDGILEISTKINTLKKLCEELKNNLDAAEKYGFVKCPELLLLDDSVNTILNTTSFPQEINITQVKLSLEGLQLSIAMAQDEIIGFSVDNPIKLHHETKILKSIDDIEKTIASLVQLRFIDIGEVSNPDNYVSIEVAKEVQHEKLKKIESVVEINGNLTQHLSHEMPNKIFTLIENYVKAHNDEMILLCCLFNQRLTPKRIIKMLQIFYDLCQNLKQCQLHQQHSHTSECLNEWMVNSEECLKHIQSFLIVILQSHSHFLFDIPISNIRTNELFLHTILETNENANLFDFVKLLINTIKSIKPCFQNIQADVLNELESYEVNSDAEDDTYKKFNILHEYSSDNIKKNNNQEIEAIFRVIEKHADCKSVRGVTKKIILIKCISDCINVLKSTLEGRLLTSNKNDLLKILLNLSEDVECFYNKILIVGNENLKCIEKSHVLKDLEWIEPQLEAISQVSKKLEKGLECKNLSLENNYNISLAKDLVNKIHLIEKCLQSIVFKSTDQSEDIKLDMKPIKEINRVLSILLSKEFVVINEENRQLKERTDSLVQHMEHYIEIIEIVEEVSAVLKLDDLKKSASIARELRESVALDSSPNVIISVPELNTIAEQKQIVQNLQEALTALNVEAFDCEQEFAPPISDDIRQQIVKVVSDIQNDLVALTSIFVVLENTGTLANVTPTDKSDLIIIKEEKPGNFIENEQYVIVDLEVKQEDSSQVLGADIDSKYAESEIIQIEQSQPTFEVSTTPCLGVSEDNKQSESELTIQEVGNQTGTENFVFKNHEEPVTEADTIEESLVQHINEYLCEDILMDIRKILPYENFNQLEQLALEVRDNAISKYTCLHQEYLKKQLERVLKLQHAMVEAYDKNLGDALDQTLQALTGKDSLQALKLVFRNLLKSLEMYVVLINTIPKTEREFVDDKVFIEETPKIEKVTNICTENIYDAEDPSIASLIEKRQPEEQNIDSDNINFEVQRNEMNVLSENITDIVVKNSKADMEELKKEIASIVDIDEEMLNQENISFPKHDEEIPINVHEAECEIKDGNSLTTDTILIDNEASNKIDTSTSVLHKEIQERADTIIAAEKSSAIHELEILLQEVNEMLSLKYPLDQTSEELQDTLEEVQTVIMKLKCDFDGSTNDFLNENIEDLECNVRSVQLQINESGPPALLKEACANLQSLVAGMKTIYNTHNKSTEITANNALSECTNDAEKSVELLDKISFIKDDRSLDSFISILNGIKDSMESLKSGFSADAESLIVIGIQVLQNLDHVEDKVFALEKELEEHIKIDVNFRDSIIAAIHSIYGSISNMRGTISSIQKKYMYDNYGEPSDRFLKAIKNVNHILKCDKKKDWKIFAKSLRKVLNHFEDIKFYINFDKTARLPSDSAFTKIILGELRNVLSEVVSQNISDIDKKLMDELEDAVMHVGKILDTMENQTTLEVKEKIPIFKELSVKMFDLTNCIKTLITKSSDITDQLLIENKVLPEPEDVEKRKPASIKHDKIEDQLYKSKDTTLSTDDSINEINEKDTSHDTLKEVENKGKYCQESESEIIEKEEINTAEIKDIDSDKFLQDYEISSLELNKESKDMIAKPTIDETRNIIQETMQDTESKKNWLNVDHTDQDIESSSIKNDIELNIKIEENDNESRDPLNDNVKDVNEVASNNDLIGLELRNMNKNISMQEIVGTETEFPIETLQKVQSREEFSSVSSTECQAGDLTGEIKNEKFTMESKQDDNLKEESNNQCKQELQNENIVDSIELTTNDESMQDKHDVLKQQLSIEVAQNIEKAEQIVLDDTMEYPKTLESLSIVSDSIAIQEAEEEKNYSTPEKPHVILMADFENENNKAKMRQNSQEILSQDPPQYTKQNDVDIEEEIGSTSILLDDNTENTVAKIHQKERDFDSVELSIEENKNDHIQNTKILLTDKIEEIKNDPNGDNIAEVAITELSEIGAQQSINKAEIKEETLEKTSKERAEFSFDQRLKSDDLEIVIKNKDDSQQNLQDAVINKLHVDGVESLKEIVVKTESDINSVPNEQSAPTYKIVPECEKIDNLSSSEEKFTKEGNPEECQVAVNTRLSDINRGGPLLEQTANSVEISQRTEDDYKLILHESADFETSKLENLQDDEGKAVSKEKQSVKNEKNVNIQDTSVTSKENYKNELHISTDIDYRAQDNEITNAVEIPQGTKDENKFILYKSTDIDTGKAKNLEGDVSQTVFEEKQLDKSEKSTYKEDSSETSKENYKKELHISTDSDDTSQYNQTPNVVEIPQGTKDENKFILYESAYINTGKAENLKDDVSQAISKEKQLDKDKKTVYIEETSEISKDNHKNELQISTDIDDASQDNKTANLVVISQGTKDESKLILHESVDTVTGKAENLKVDVSQTVFEEKQFDIGEKSIYKLEASEASEEPNNSELQILTDIDYTSTDNQTANPIEIFQGTEDQSKLILHESGDTAKAENLEDDVSQAVYKEKRFNKGEKSTQEASKAGEEHDKNKKKLHISTDIDDASQDSKTANLIVISQGTKDENKLILHESVDIDTGKAENLKDIVSQAFSKKEQLDKCEKSIHIQEASETREYKNELQVLKDIANTSQDKQKDIIEKNEEICEIPDSPKTMAEDHRNASKLNEIGEGILSMKIFETDNNKGQYTDEVVLTSKESKNEGENTQAGTKQGREPSIKKSNEEETHMNELNSLQNENNKKELNDKTGICEVKSPVSDTLLGKDLSTPCMEEVCMESTSKSFKTEQGPIISIEKTDYKEKQIIVHQSETQSDKKEEEGIYTEDLNNKLKENEPNMPLEHKEIQKQVCFVNENKIKQTEKDASQPNDNIIEYIEKLIEPKEKIDNIYKEPDILEKSETIVNNKDIPDSKSETGQDKKLKTKVKKGKKVDKPEKKEPEAQIDKISPISKDPVGNETDNDSKNITEENRDTNQNKYEDDVQNLLTGNESKHKQKQEIPQGDQPVVQIDKKDEHIQKDLIKKSSFETKQTSENDTNTNEEFKKQQTKIVIEENNRDQDLIKTYKAAVEDSQKIENKRLNKKESHGKEEKDIGAINNTEIVTKMLERDLLKNDLKQDLLLTALDHEINKQYKDKITFEEKQEIINTPNIIKIEEEGVNTLPDPQNQQKIINERERDKDCIQTDSEILCPFNKAKEYEILKSDEPLCAEHTPFDEYKTLHTAVNVYQEPLEFKEGRKETFAESFYLHSLEKIATSSDDNQESSMAFKTSMSESKVEKHRNKELKQRPSYIDCSERDYELEFNRPSGYNYKPVDMDGSTTEFQTYGKSPIIYKAQTLVHEAQLKSTVPPYDQRLITSEGYTDLNQRTKTTSESRSTISEKRASFPRDFKRKPVFSTHLTDRTAVESSRVKLTCSILSSTDPTISWYKNGILIDNKQKCRTKHVDGLITLEILNAVPSDSGEYSCTVKNENGSVTSSASLKVYPGFEASPIPPTFTRSIRDVYHIHENELVLECRIRGQPLPTITWLKDNRPIILNERYQAHYLADGVCRLTINSPHEDDSGKYTCKAENSMWSDQITHDVQFTSKESRYIKNVTRTENRLTNRQASESRRPHFTNVLSDHKVVSGGTIGLQVEISGWPTRVEWLREGHSVIENYRNAQTYIDHGLYTLALPDVTEKESGLYTCRAWSTHGNVDMNASITVVQPNQFDGKPARIISRPVKDLLISVGEDLNISFRVQGEPKPKVFFIKGIRDITNSQRVCKMTSDDYVKFTLKRSVVSDAGTYCVFVRNAYGCDRAFVTVVIRQRASSDNLISDWTYPMDDLAISVVDRNYKSVPDRIPSEPNTVDGGNNWVSLAWPKPDSQAKAPILAYKVESWLLGKEGGARWTELGITPRNSFDAFNLKQGEEYHFRVTPRNRYGWGESVQTSTPIGIGLAGDRPEFVEILPGQLKVLVGETATLCCSFKGNPIPEIMWMKNGHEVEEEANRVTIELGGNSTSLQINNINNDDEGRYSCEATNIHGRSSTYSRMAVITDRQIWAADAKLKRERSAGANGDYPPQFTMRLRDRRVQATYPVRLTCQVIGSPSPIVTWFKNGEDVILDSRHSTSQDEYFHTLEIAPTTLEDGGVYEAMARNGCGAISCRCNLVVDKGIRAYIAPEFCCGFEPLYRVCEGDELRISAVVEAYPSVGVTWYRDGVRLRTSRRAVMTLDRDGQIELALAAVAARDAGVYTCTASNEVGRASTSGKVEVIKGESRSETPKVPPIVISPDVPYSKEPMFIRKPRSSEAREGDTVLLECEVIGDPKPDVYWLRDFLKPDYYRDASHFKRVGAGPAYRFEIPHAKLDYTGAYSIVAKNIHGEAKAIISLQILAKDPSCSNDTHNIRYGRVDIMPRFEKDLTDLLCYDGDAIEFECLVSGNPEPDIRWFHYTELLPECSDFESSFELGTARLKIKQVTAEDEGTYTCEASNEMGKATSSACLVIYPPGEPNTLSQRLRRPPALLSACSTPRSTPRTTPVRSQSRTPGPDLRRLCSPSREIAPKFYTYPYNKVVEEGDTVVFQCAVKGLPPPWASWDKDGIIITPTARISVREKDDMFRILEIEQVTVEDVGLYRVTLENDYGRAEASARLEVISQTGKFYGSRSYSVSPRKCLPYRRRTPSLTRQD